MNKYIGKIGLFFFIIILVDINTGFLCDYMQANAKGGETKCINDLLMNDYHDIIIFGSSRAHHHYDTPLLSDSLGIDIYNAGYDGNGVILAYGLLEVIVERYKPKVILLDIEPAFDIYIYDQDNNHTRYISRIKPYYKHHRIGDIIKDVSSEEWYKVHSGLLRYNSQITSLAKDYFIGAPCSNKGYEPLYGVYQVPLDKKVKNKGKIIDDFKIKYVEKFIQLAKEQGIPVVLAASPKYGAYDSDLSPIIEICNFHHVPFWNYYENDEFTHHSEWFKEPMHLNCEGAKIFSTRIINQIKSIINTNY